MGTAKNIEVPPAELRVMEALELAEELDQQLEKLSVANIAAAAGIHTRTVHRILDGTTSGMNLDPEQVRIVQEMDLRRCKVRKQRALLTQQGIAELAGVTRAIVQRIARDRAAVRPRGNDQHSVRGHGRDAA